MTKLLLHLFLRKYRDPSNSAYHAAVGKLAGMVGVFCNIALCAAKMTVGFLAGSVSIMADAWNNLSDAAASVVALLGFRMAQRPADQDHPFGHARYEYLSALTVAVLILLIGLELGKSALEKIFAPSSVEISAVTIIVLLLSMAVKLWMMGWFRATGKLIDSDTLKATALDSRNDVLATGGVLLGCLLGSWLNIPVDGWIGLAVALFILHSGVDMVRQTVSPLLGKQADAGLVKKISQVILSHDKVLGIHDLLVHDYGPGRCFASVHAEVSAKEDLMACHDLIDDIERDVLREVNVHIVIHYDPVDVDDRQWQSLRRIVERTVFVVDPRLSVHDFRLSGEGEQTKMIFDLDVPYAVQQTRQELKAAIDDSLRQQGVNFDTNIHFDGKE